MPDMMIGEHIRANYEDGYNEGGSEWRRLCSLSKVNNIVTLCSDLPRKSILEIGAGEGSILQRLGELGFGEELYALEISSSAARTIKSRAISRLVECQVFDGYHIPFDRDRFDLAILSHVIEHVEHPRQLLYEASRVAKHVFVEVPLEDTIRLPRDYTPDTLGHLDAYSPKTIRRLIQSCNLRVLRQITTNPSKESFVHQHGRSKGLMTYYIKQGLLKVLPTIATRVVTYHEALVCEKTTFR